MITLIGMWEKGWLDTEVEYFMWKQLCHAYNVDRLVMVPRLLNRVNLDQYHTVEEALKFCNGEFIFMEPKGKILLNDLTHPENAVYIFGNASTDNRRFQGVEVRIDTPENVDIFAINAAAIVLADRYER